MVGAERWQEAEQIVATKLWLPRGLLRNLETLAVEELASTSDVAEDLLLEALARRAGAFRK